MKAKNAVVLLAIALIVSVGIVSNGADNGKMASQNWVNYRIAQQETNTQSVVDSKMTNSMLVVDYKLNLLKEQLDAAINQATEILSKSNTPAAMSNAYNVIKTSAGPVADYYLNSCSITF